MHVMVRVGLASMCALMPMAVAAQRRFGIRVRPGSDDTWVLWLVVAIAISLFALATIVLAPKDEARRVGDPARAVSMRGRLIMRKVMVAMMMIGQGGSDRERAIALEIVSQMGGSGYGPSELDREIKLHSGDEESLVQFLRGKEAQLTPYEKVVTVNAAWNVACADGPPGSAQRRLILGIAHALNVRLAPHLESALKGETQLSTGGVTDSRSSG